jgi:hypothetical protein
MALSASGLYRLSAEQLRVECSGRGLSSSGPVRVLRSRLSLRPTRWIEKRSSKIIRQVLRRSY